MERGPLTITYKKIQQVRGGYIMIQEANNPKIGGEVHITQWVDIKEAAKLTGLSEWSLREGVKTGRFPAIRVSGK